MKIIEENVDLRDFKAWSEARNVLAELIKYDTVDKAQEYVEELWPEGVTETTLNDWLWFECRDDHPEWFDDNRDEKEEVRSKILETHRSKGPLGFVPLMEADGGTLYRLNYEDDDDDFSVFKLVAESQCVTNNISGWVQEYEVDYDFDLSFEDNVEALKKEMAEDGVLPALPSGMEYVEDFPVWAIVYCMYNDASGLSDEKKKLVDDWMEDNGYGELVDSLEATKNSFDKYPEFGLACETETVVMRKKKEGKDV